MEANKYFNRIEDEIKEIYKVAEQARSVGYDPVDHVEIPLARNMVERVEGLISVVAPQLKKSGMVERMQELENQYGKVSGAHLWYRQRKYRIAKLQGLVECFHAPRSRFTQRREWQSCGDWWVAEDPWRAASLGACGGSIGGRSYVYLSPRMPRRSSKEHSHEFPSACFLGR